LIVSEPFIHLCVHSDLSLVDGVVRIKKLVAGVRDRMMPAVGLTEQGNLFSLVKFYRSAMGAGIKPIIGADVMLAGDDDGAALTRLTLLCQTDAGYQNLSVLLSEGYRIGQIDGRPTLSRSLMEVRSQGLIVFAGGVTGELGLALLDGRTGDARAVATYWRDLLGDRFYIDLVRTGRAGENTYIERAVELAWELDIPVVAHNDVRFLAPQDYESHEVRVCIHESRTLADPRRSRAYSEQQYLRSSAEMAELFADIPEAIANTLEIAKRCNVELRLNETFLPDFEVPDGHTTESWFEQESKAGLEPRLTGLFGETVAEHRAPYDERLRMELDVINGMGFPGYFLIVADFIRWARENGVPVGPGRGSGAGSLVAYAMGITDLDPIGYDLLFERFLNPERVSMPDFDVDFCMEGRDRVIDYVVTRYGADRVSQIITFGTMAAKAVVRDVGRVQGHPYGFVDQLAKLIPFEVGMTLDKAFEQEEALRERYEADEDVRQLFDMARSLEGMARNPGRHAGGVVISPSALTDYTPLYFEPGGTSPVSQLDKDDVEAVGLVKFDFLGLRTLTIIDWALASINAQRELEHKSPVDLARIPMDDRGAFNLIMSAATTAVFQLESRGMRELIKKLQPDRFEDIIALVALFRPGPLQSGMVDDFIDRKHGRAVVEYPHPDVGPVLEPTYGVILYQEQVMQIAQVLAGFTLGGADLLRRAMGKKKVEEMAQQRSAFVDGSVARGVANETATYIFDLMEKFAGYGFNRSHSAAYALVAYQTAWLKAHHPAHFMAAVLSADMDSTDKVVTLIDECRSMGIKVDPPNVNTCVWKFSVEDDAHVGYGLGAIKGVGQGAVDSIVEQRAEAGPFDDLFDFCRRVDSKRVNRRVIEALVRCGSMDSMAPTRSGAMASLEVALQSAEQHARDLDAGQNDMFGGAAEPAAREERFEHVPPWSDQERLKGEKETLGLYLTGHPVNRYMAELERLASDRIARLAPNADRVQRAAGLVVGLRSVNSRRGRMAILTLDDGTARMEAVAFSDVYQRVQRFLVKDQILIAEGVLGADEFSGGCSMTIEDLYDMDAARARFARGMVVQLDQEAACPQLLEQIRDVLAPYCHGPARLYFEYKREDATALLPCSDAWKLAPTDELLDRLRSIDEVGAVTVRYA
jgi:DNA polymerase III subunit alpha